MALTMGRDEINLESIQKLETLEELLKRVTADGKIDKKELQDILARKDIEAEGVKKETKDALSKLKTEGLQDILKNGLTLKKGDDSIMQALKTYTPSKEIEEKFATLKDGESFVVSLKGNEIVMAGLLNYPLNDDSADIRNTKEGIVKKESQATNDIIATNSTKEAKKKLEVDAFKSAKTLTEMQGVNDASIANTTKLLEEKIQTLGDNVADKGTRAKINSLLSSYKDVKILLEALRKSSKTVSESQQKQNEVDMYQNNLYKLNQKAEDILGQKEVSATTLPQQSVLI